MPVKPIFKLHAALPGHEALTQGSGSGGKMSWVLCVGSWLMIGSFYLLKLGTIIRDYLLELPLDGQGIIGTGNIQQFIHLAI
jgi:hypothetical protein